MTTDVMKRPARMDLGGSGGTSGSELPGGSGVAGELPWWVVTAEDPYSSGSVSGCEGECTNRRWKMTSDAG